MPTQVPDIIITEAGPVIPEQVEIIRGRQSDFKSAFGADLDVREETPQGQLITSDSAIINDTNEQILYFMNMFDPNKAQGRWQDALGQIYCLDRHPATPTYVDCLCTGAPGTIIPAGALAQSVDGDLFQAVAGGVIASSGNTNLQFKSVESGPVEAPPNSVTRIYRTIPGWDSITNPTTGTLGRMVETQAEFEQRRRASVALNGHGSVQAIYAAIANVNGVVDLHIEENVTDNPITIKGVTINGHSILASVAGGADYDVAFAIFTKKSAGCGMDGNTEITVYWQDNLNNQIPYLVRYERPATLDFKVQVRIHLTPNTPANAVDLIKQAVVDNFYGLLDTCGQPRVRIGERVYAARFYSSVTMAAGGGENIISVIEILIDTVETPQGWREFVDTTIDRLPSLTLDNVSVIIEGAI